MANALRKQVQDLCLSIISDITHGDKNNKKLYEDLFNGMSDAEFDSFMSDLRDGRKHLSIIVPHGNEVKIDLKNNLTNVSKKLGFDFFQQIVNEEEVNADGSIETPGYITPHKYLIMKLPIRRASQLLMKKISVPTDNTKRDILTGQVTGTSRARRITYPEIQVLIGYGLSNTINELMTARGGDKGLSNAMSASLIRTGQVKQADIEPYSQGVMATKTLKSYLLCMGIRSSGLADPKSR